MQPRITPAFETLKGQADALYVVGDALTNANRTPIIRFACQSASDRGRTTRCALRRADRQRHDCGAHPGLTCAWQSSVRRPISPNAHGLKRPQDLTSHACINLRLPTYGNLYAWEFEKNGRHQFRQLGDIGRDPTYLIACDDQNWV